MCSKWCNMPISAIGGAVKSLIPASYFKKSRLWYLQLRSFTTKSFVSSAIHLYSPRNVAEKEISLGSTLHCCKHAGDQRSMNRFLGHVICWEKQIKIPTHLFFLKKSKKILNLPNLDCQSRGSDSEWFAHSKQARVSELWSQMKRMTSSGIRDLKHRT